MEGVRKGDSYYSNHKLVQATLGFQFHYKFQRSHKRFKWNLVGWLETFEGTPRRHVFCISCSEVCQALIITLPILFQKTVTPAGLLEGQDLGQENIHKSRTSKDRALADKCHAEGRAPHPNFPKPAPSVTVCAPTLSRAHAHFHIAVKEDIWGCSLSSENTVASSWTAPSLLTQIPEWKRHRLGSQKVPNLKPNSTTYST